MRMYVSGATATLRKYCQDNKDILGCFPTPHTKNNPTSLAELGLPIAADNGCFNSLDSQRFVVMLNAYREAGVKLEWVAVPDAVCDMDTTYKLWGKWEKVVRAFGHTPCMVLQNGFDICDLFIFKPQAIFIGGDDNFKLGQDVRKAVMWARQNNVPSHMGRVNSFKRIRYAIDIGCTSFDGSGFSKWPDTRIPKAIKWIRSWQKKNKVQPRLI